MVCPLVDGGGAANGYGQVECGTNGTLVLHPSTRPPELVLSLKSGSRAFEGPISLSYVETGRAVCGSRCESASAVVTLR